MVEQSAVSRRGPAEAFFKADVPASRRALKIPVSFCKMGAVLAAIDAVVIVVLAVASYGSYTLATTSRPTWVSYPLAAGCISALLFCLLMQSQRLYQPANILNQRRALTTLNVWSVVAACVLALGFLARVWGDYSRGAAVCFFASGAIILPGSRILAKRALGYLIANNMLEGRRRVLVFGEAAHMASYGVAERLKSYGYNVVGRFGTDPSDLSSIAAGLNRLTNFVKNNRVDEIFLAFEGGNRNAIQSVSHRLAELPIPVRLLFDHHMDRLLSLPVSDMGVAKSVKLQGGPLKPTAQFAKRAFDVTIASTGLILLAPLFLFIGLAIRLDSPGPVIFRQRRAGFGGRVFHIYKFRSMTSLDDGLSVRQATRNDKRVTRVGRYIRSSSIDELPQLLNVLRGEMSIVGPRPHALSHDDQYTRVISTYALRHHMKPGITGWAQVNGCRGETRLLSAMEMRIQYDLWYIKHWSMLLDVVAVTKTVWQAAFPKNVY